MLTLHQAITASYRAASIPMRAFAQSLKTKRPRWLGRSPLCATAPPAHMSPSVVQSHYRAHPATLGGPAPLRLARLLPGNNPIPALPSTTRAMRSPPISTQSPPVSSSHHSSYQLSSCIYSAARDSASLPGRFLARLTRYISSAFWHLYLQGGFRAGPDVRGSP